MRRINTDLKTIKTREIKNCIVEDFELRDVEDFELRDVEDFELRDVEDFELRDVEDFELYSVDNVKRKIYKSSTDNRDVQCKLLQLRETKINIGKEIGKGKYNYINETTIEQLKPVSKTQITQATTSSIMEYLESIVKQEALVGMYINMIIHLTPNFVYTYDYRRVYNKTTLLDSLHSVDTRRKSDSVILLENLTSSNIHKKDVNITLYKFIKKQPKLLPTILIQILLSLYIASRELGFIHLDLHDENIIITETKEDVIKYTIPLSPSTYKKLYGDYKDINKWDLTKDMWIVDDTFNDIDNTRIPIKDIDNSILDKTSIEEIQKELQTDYDKLVEELYKDNRTYTHIKPVVISVKKYTPYKHFVVRIKSSGYLAKILDFNYSSISVEGKQLHSQQTVKLYEAFELKLPEKSSVFIDMFRLCYIMFNERKLLTRKNMIDMFGRYFERIVVDDNIQKIEQNKKQKDKIEDIKKVVSKYVYAVNIDNIEDKYLDDEYFVNNAYTVLDQM